jgi:hypothetical protein
MIMAASRRTILSGRSPRASLPGSTPFPGAPGDGAPAGFRRRTGRRAGALAALLLLCLSLSFLSSRADIDRPDLWKKTFRATLVVRITVMDGDNRMAKVEVNEVIKGSYAGETLKVVFRAVNLSRDVWSERIVFPQGARMILFLRPFIKKGVVNAPDQFELVGGHHGLENVPAEGNDAYLQAIRRFVAIQSIDSQLAIWEETKLLLQEENPYLVQAGLDQVLKFRLADETLVPVLLDRMEDDTVAFRAKAAQALGQVLADSRRERKTLMTEDHMRDLLLYRAMNDDSVEVRVEAIRALEAGRDRELVPTFRRIAREDPSQAVRYQAERTIFEIEGKKNPDKN